MGRSYSLTVGGTPLRTRNATRQPFDPLSPWCLPIGTAPDLETTADASTASWLQAGTTYWINGPSNSHPVNYASASDPVATVTQETGRSNAPFNPDTNTYNISATSYIADQTDYATYHDHHSHVIDANGQVVHENFYMTKLSNTAYTARRQSGISLYGMGTGPQQGSRAYGGPALGGLIRLWEFDTASPYYTGKIQHAVAMALPFPMLFWNNAFPRAYYTSHSSWGTGAAPPGWFDTDDHYGFLTPSGYVWPATEQDVTGSSSYTGGVPMGAYFTIPSTVNLTSLALSAAGLMLATAIQDYGAYVTDTTGTGTLVTFYAEDPGAAGYPATSTYFRSSLTGNNGAEIKKIAGQMVRVKTGGQNGSKFGNSAATPNAATLAGTRRQPLLPALA